MLQAAFPGGEDPAGLPGEEPAAPFKPPVKCAVTLHGLFKHKGWCLAQGQTQSQLLKNVLKMQ